MDVDPDEVAQGFWDAVSKVYSPDTEYMVLSWDLVPVAVDYHYDMYVLVDDIVLMLEGLLAEDFSEVRVAWGSSSFRAVWWIRPKESGDGPRELVLDSEWDCILGSYEFLLNERREITVERDEFIGRWFALLRKLVADVEAKNVRMEDTMMFDRAKALIGAAGEGS
jgi:hypothetical protein